MKRILFICTGNTCRSSMAEALMRSLLIKERLDKEYEAESAGVYASEGQSASENAVHALSELDIDLTKHSSRLVSDEMLRNAYLILTMTTGHKMHLLRSKPELRDKLYTLKEYCCEEHNKDVMDPFGCGIKTYRECRDDIMESLVSLVDKLKQEG